MVAGPGGVLAVLGLALELDLAVDQGDLAAGEAVEGVGVEEGDVGVLAHLDRADAAVEAELASRVDGDHGQGLILGHRAVLDHLGGFEVEVTDQLLASRS